IRFPVAASKQRQVSMLPASRPITYTRPLAITGPEYPSPTTADQIGDGGTVGHSLGSPFVPATPSRAGPRHCSQSSALAIALIQKSRIRLRQYVLKLTLPSRRG